MKKTSSCICPKCGETSYQHVSCLGGDIDGPCYIEDWVCNKCDSYWTEYYTLTWDGYNFEDQVYDYEGNPV